MAASPPPPTTARRNRTRRGEPPSTTASPPPPTTIRRNPPRLGRPPPTPTPTPARSTKSKPKSKPLSRLLDEEVVVTAAGISPLPPPPPTPPDDTAPTPAPPPTPPADAGISPIPPPPPPNPTAIVLSSSSQSAEERLKVYLRIRPLPAPERERGGKPGGRPKAKEQQARKPPKQAGDGVCLVATGPNSVALTVPQSKLVDHKRGRTEVFDGFSAVLPPDCSQHDLFSQVMNPLVDDFLGGKSGLLVAMGPTGSGKTHTVFGTARHPGIVPLTLQKIFNTEDESDVGSQPTRSFCLSMFEILSEGKAERILDLLSDAADLVLQQSSIIKGLKEVDISNFMDAESLVSRGMLKRSTAATNANSESSRSQCIITVRATHKNNDLQSEHLIGGSVLTIADLAGAERKKSTGNMGSRLLESNFINNTSMVFGNCLRALLDHQKNQKKTLEKHFKNSMLTRYLRDYLEGRKKMTLILNVKQGDDDYSDTSYLLRQASPYMKIRYTSLDDSSDLASQKRSSVSLICQENKKRRKVHKPEALTAEGKGSVDKSDEIKLSEKDEFLNSELQRVSRNEQIMKNLFRALWAVSKQKLMESESAARSMKELLSEKDNQIRELKKELNDLKSCSHEKFPVDEDTPGQAALSSASQSNQTDMGSNDVAFDDFNLGTELVVEEVSEEFRCYDSEKSSANSDKKGKFVDCDTSRYLKTEEPCTSDAFAPKCNVQKESTKIMGQMVDKKLDNSESFSEQASVHDVAVTHATRHFDHPSDQSFTDHHILPCIKSEHANPSPHGCGPMELREEELSKLEDSQHDVDVKDEKQNCPSQVIKDKGDHQAEGITDKKEDLSASQPRKTKKNTRRLLPISAMMLKDFTGHNMDVAADAKRAADVGGKSSGEAAPGGRSEKLIQLLKARPVTKNHHRC
ncbi:kinesin-like protein KIN-6 isoform X2 [Lolium perenne]|uniref:kinesin-like protein KIN-6 isoform X2 n=1 Tax=Lolium perenne TaxID=4522 RepID=UPI0021F51ED4|nr:kinesin-like protein KIN-6 isoform X2 [Lolium perenne]